MNPTGKEKIRIGEALVEEGYLTQQQLARVLGEQKRTGRILGEMLLEQELVTVPQLLSALSKRLGLRSCQLRSG
ncbi:MAG: type II secretion system protein GspE, partial [Planctomycetota bacterium]|nr:type II secretion system protein GspE [Planctomycetota bacterium]